VATQTMGREWLKVLAEVPLFAGLSRRQLGHVGKVARPHRVRRLTKIVREGDRGDAFYVILDGTASVRQPGRRPITLRTGEFFGELALLDGAPRTATVEAQDEVLTMRIGRTDFVKMLEREPKVAVAMLAAIASRLRAAQRSATL
jgi:CRP/FNR family transcriptional regulator, cyclic AMP receptor protein